MRNTVVVKGKEADAGRYEGHESGDTVGENEVARVVTVDVLGGEEEHGYGGGVLLSGCRKGGGFSFERESRRGNGVWVLWYRIE